MVNLYVTIAFILRAVAPNYCYEMAELKNRNGFRWSLLGFLFPVITAIILYYIEPKVVFEEENKPQNKNRK